MPAGSCIFLQGARRQRLRELLPRLRAVRQEVHFRAKPVGHRPVLRGVLSVKAAGVEGGGQNSQVSNHLSHLSILCIPGLYYLIY